MFVRQWKIDGTLPYIKMETQRCSRFSMATGVHKFRIILWRTFHGKFFKTRKLDSDPVGVLKRSFHECDEDIIAEHYDDSHRKRYPGPGSTAVVVLILPPKAFVAHVGDSRAIFVNSEGQIVFQTKDQRPDCPLEHSRILRLGGTVRAVKGLSVHLGF